MVARGELPPRQVGFQAKVRQARHAGLLPVRTDVLGRGRMARRIARIGWIVQIGPTDQSLYTHAARAVALETPMQPDRCLRLYRAVRRALAAVIVVASAAPAAQAQRAPFDSTTRLLG